jgi:hypothetical protein
VLTRKYGFHLPLYRQCQIFAHAGMTLSRTTLMQWAGASSQLLGPLVAALAWMIESVSQIDRKSDLAAAFHYSLNRWEALCRYTQDGRLEIDNNIAERSIRGIGKALAENTVVDEVLPEIKRRRGP